MKQKEYVKKREIKKTTLITIICIVCLVLLVLIYFIIINYDKTTYENHDIYVYEAGKKYNYSGTITLSKKRGITSVDDKKDNLVITSTPIYFGDTKATAVLPSDMILIDFKQAKKIYKVGHYAKIKNKDGVPRLEVNNETKYIDPCILYDGADLYFFPYETTLTVNEEEYKLSPLSYARVNYHNEVEIYSFNTDKYFYIESHDKDIIASILGNEVNLDTDMIISDKSTRLLVHSMENLPLYK